MRNELGKNEPDDEPLDEPRLRYPLDYVIETWMEHRFHHRYPAPGGYDDQDDLLMRDWSTLNRRVNYFMGIYSDKTRSLDLNAIPGAIEENLFG